MPVATVTKRWTIEELDALPEDGNTYELIHGELFVTPAPTDTHETILARLARILDRYVERHNLGYCYRPKAVMQREDSQVEPDIQVRQPHPDQDHPAWDRAPTPSLVVEALSPSTKRLDRTVKRAFYLEMGVPEYWIVDGKARTITVIRGSGPDHEVSGVIEWHPEGATEPLRFDVSEIFAAKRS